MPTEVDALTPPLRKSRDGEGLGKKGSGKSPRKPADGENLLRVRQNRTLRERLLATTGTGRRKVGWQGQKGKARGKKCSKGEGKVNNISDEPPEQ